MLSEGLAATSVAGNPREWFNAFEEQNQRARWRLTHTDDLTYAAYLDQLLTERASSNGVYGIKLHYYQFAELPQKLSSVPRLAGLTGARLLSAAFPHVRYVWLTRRDKERQAVSFYIAARTGTWWVVDGARQSVPEAPAPDFDPHCIARFQRALTDHDAKWQAFFEGNGIAPLVVYYEDLLADYPGQIAKVLNALGIERADQIVIPPPRLKRQSDARNEDWLARYAAFTSERARAGTAMSSSEIDRVFSERSDKAYGTISDSWGRWIRGQQAANAPDGAIVDVLVHNGYHREAALVAVAHAAEEAHGTRDARLKPHKAAALLNALGQLKRLDSRAEAIDRRVNLSHAEFRDEYYAANRPVVISGLLTGWRALTAWTPAYLKQRVGDRVVEIMSGRDADPLYEIHATWHRSKIRFADYIDMVYAGGETNDYNLVANNGFFQQPEMHPLLDDVAPIPSFLRPVERGQQCFLWFGPAGTRTPLHHDTSNILAAQITGRKRYRMIPASQWQYVYNRGGVFSDVDAEAPDFTRYPEFRNATIMDVVLEPGECLFVPVGWWHDVRALDISVTVSFTNFAFPNHFSWESQT